MRGNELNSTAPCYITVKPDPFERVLDPEHFYTVLDHFYTGLDHFDTGLDHLERYWIIWKGFLDLDHFDTGLDPDPLDS